MKTRHVSNLDTCWLKNDGCREIENTAVVEERAQDNSNSDWGGQSRKYDELWGLIAPPVGVPSAQQNPIGIFVTAKSRARASGSVCFSFSYHDSLTLKLAFWSAVV
ncbi:hypothetical protein SDJN03_18015, partial [Cucurbita argyrosperma subsp. sororia]